MSKITICGDALVVTSALKFEDICLVNENRPKELTLWGEENGKPVPDFSISATCGKGNISPFGICFGGATHDGNGFASITGYIPAGDGDVKERVANQVGAAVLKLNELEEKLPPVIEEIKAQKQAMLDSIQLI